VAYYPFHNNRLVDKVVFACGGFYFYKSNFIVGGIARDRLEVIGNIHDNPELLEEGK
jgi:hypothetical protein